MRHSLLHEPIAGIPSCFPYRDVGSCVECTSESRLAVISRTSLCLKDGNLPLGQGKACSMEKE